VCGIAGIYKGDSRTTPDDLAAVRRMMNAQAHRGPDGKGLFRDERVVLGHRRLSIIDRSYLMLAPVELLWRHRHVGADLLIPWRVRTFIGRAQVVPPSGRLHLRERA